MSEGMRVIIDEAMTERQLAAALEDHDAWVSYDGGTMFGMVSEYEPDFGLFLVVPHVWDDATSLWHPTDPEMVEPMDRHHFAIEGGGVKGALTPPPPRGVQVTEKTFPNGEQIRTVEGHYSDLGYMEPDPRLEPFIGAMRELVLVGMGDFCSNEATFKVRLDVAVRDPHKHEPDTHGPVRTYRILLRPVMQPMMHDEILAAAKIAEKHDLAINLATGGSGLELRTPDDQLPD